MEPMNEEQMLDRHAVVFGKEEIRHDEIRMRDIHIGRRGSETANEEQPDKLRKTVRFEQEARNTVSSSTLHVSLEYPASGESQDRPEAVFVQNSGHVDDDIPIFALDAFDEMDGRKSPYTKEVLDWYREQDAGGLRRNDVNELVGNMTASNQNIVMNEKFVKNSVMNEK